MAIYAVPIDKSVADQGVGDTISLRNADESTILSLSDADDDGVWLVDVGSDWSKIDVYDVYKNGNKLTSQNEALSLFFLNEAILELKNASFINYSNGSSGLAATDVQAAIDEIVGALPSNAQLLGTDAVDSTHILFGTDSGANEVNDSHLPLHGTANPTALFGESTGTQEEATTALINFMGLSNGKIPVPDTAYVKGLTDLAAMIRKLDRSLQDAVTTEQARSRVIYTDGQAGDSADGIAPVIHTHTNGSTVENLVVVPFWKTTAYRYLTFEFELLFPTGSVQDPIYLAIQYSHDWGSTWTSFDSYEIDTQGSWLQRSHQYDIVSVAPGLVLARVTWTDPGTNPQARGVQLTLTTS